MQGVKIVWFSCRGLHAYSGTLLEVLVSSTVRGDCTRKYIVESNAGGNQSYSTCASHPSKSVLSCDPVARLSPHLE
jgi:hypothetical protein